MPAENDSCDPDKAMEAMLHSRICLQKETNNKTSQEKAQRLPGIDVFLNPMKEKHKKSIIAQKKNVAKSYFNDSDMKTLYPELFRLLWKSSLPCFNEEEEEEKEHMLLSCEVAGKEIKCSDIFTRVPTDIGICCALNVDDLLREIVPRSGERAARR